MSLNMQIKKSWVLTGLAGLLLSSFTCSLFAGEEKTIEQYVEEARPYLHLSCQGAWDASGEDPDEYVAIMNRFVSIAFINHDFDVERITRRPRQTRTNSAFCSTTRSASAVKSIRTDC